MITTACDKTISKTIRNKTYTFIKNDKNLITSKDQFTFKEHGKGIEKVTIDPTPNDKNDSKDVTKEFNFKYEIDNNNSQIKIIYSNTHNLLQLSA